MTIRSEIVDGVRYLIVGTDRYALTEAETAKLRTELGLPLVHWVAPKIPTATIVQATK